MVAVTAVALAHRAHLPTELWRRDLHCEGPVYFAADGARLVCVTPSRRVAALRAGSGELLWPLTWRGLRGFGAPPVLVGPRVLCVDDDGSVMALAAASGDLLWQAGTGGPVRGLPCVAGDVLYVGSADGNLYCLGLADGIERWRLATGAPINSGCALVEGTLVFGTDEGTVYGVDVATHACRWAKQMGAPVLGRPTPMGREVIVSGDSGRVFWLEVLGGAVAGWVDVPRMGLVRAPPLTEGSRVYLASTDGWLTAYDRQATALPLWARKVGRELPAGPIMDQQNLYCATGGGTVVCVSKLTGQILRRWETQGRVEGSLALAESLLLAGTAEGRVVAFGLAGE